MELTGLFFELIRVSVGTQEGLSRLPSEAEWDELYAMAEKQSLVGICFAGLQNLGADADDGFTRIGMSELQYLNWMSVAATIQERNDAVNRQCGEVQEKLRSLGYRSCILKGQSAARLYIGHLSELRQSGDIDVWVDAPKKVIIALVQKIAPTSNVREHHLELKMFPDTEVEVHFWPAVIRHFIKNRRLQRWLGSRREVVFELGLPTPEFHAVQMMAHMYHHLFDSGIGLRQVMDYFFVLQVLGESPCDNAADGQDGASMASGGSKTGSGWKDGLAAAYTQIGMGRFASAMMYVLQVTMCLDRALMPVQLDEKDGKFLLGEIMRGGNFGHHDDRKIRSLGASDGDSQRHSFGGYFRSFFGGVLRNFRYLRFNPFDWFWSPLWRLWYFAWRRVKGYE